MAVAPCGINRDQFPFLLTNCVKTIGRELSATAENQELKKRICFINQIAVLDWDRGIFRITFDGGGNARHHRLSKTRTEELRLQDNFVQDVVGRVAREVVCGMSFYQEEIGIPLKYAEKLQQTLENPTRQVRGMLDNCGFREFYSLPVADRCHTLFVIRNRDRFDPEPILREVVTPDECNGMVNRRLLNSCIPFTQIAITLGDPPTVEIKFAPAVEAKLAEIRARYQNHATGMARVAYDYITNLQAAQPRTQEGEGMAIALEEILQLISSG